MAVYAEGTTDAGTLGYLDFQRNYAGLYTGADGEFATDDDTSYKGRVRITGGALWDDNEDVSYGRSDFSFIKHDTYDRVEGEDVEQFYELGGTGRGGYGVGESSLFGIRHDQTTFGVEDTIADRTDYFCIKHTGDPAPDYVDVEAGEDGSTDCQSYEESLPWETEFPFALSPELATNFAEMEVFEGNDTDLISNSGENFIIPEYETVE